jgi:Amidohydrolase family
LLLSNAADLLGHSSEIGSIKPGKYADLVAVSGDPLTNISVLENVEFNEGGYGIQAGGKGCLRSIVVFVWSENVEYFLKRPPLRIAVAIRRR